MKELALALHCKATITPGLSVKMPNSKPAAAAWTSRDEFARAFCRHRHSPDVKVSYVQLGPRVSTASVTETRGVVLELPASESPYDTGVADGERVGDGTRLSVAVRVGVCAATLGNTHKKTRDAKKSLMIEREKT